MSRQLAVVLVAVLPAITLAAWADCPEWLVSVDLPDVDGVFRLAVSDGYAYLVAGDGLRIIDVSTPAAPVEVGFVDTPGNAFDVAVSRNHAYVADGIGHLRVIDVSTPSAPVEVGFLDTLDWVRAVAVSGDYAYAMDDIAGLLVIDVSMPSAPMEVGSVDLARIWGFGVAVSDGYAYVAAHGQPNAGLRVINVGTPSAPVEVGIADIPSSWDVAVMGHYAYAVCGPAGFRVIDVSTPSAPVEVGFWENPNIEYRGVEVWGRYAYVADLWSGLWVIDVGIPSFPLTSGFWGDVEQAHGVAVSDGYVYLGGVYPDFSVLRDCSLPFSDGFESGDTSAWSAPLP